MSRAALLCSTCLVAALASCGRVADGPPPAEPPPDAALTPTEESTDGAGVMATFTCPDSTIIYAIFRQDSVAGSEVSLAIGDERLRLPQTISASGARYADSTTVFWNKGSEVTFEWRGVTRQCVTP